MSTIPQLPPAEALQWLKSGEGIMIDVREEGEYRQARIDGAVLVPVSRFDIDEVLRAAGEKKIIFQCRSGKRADDVHAYFTSATGREAWCLEGSLLGWIAAGLPVLSGEG